MIKLFTYYTEQCILNLSKSRTFIYKVVSKSSLDLCIDYEIHMEQFKQFESYGGTTPLRERPFRLGISETSEKSNLNISLLERKIGFLPRGCNFPVAYLLFGLLIVFPRVLYICISAGS
jgi:hypothetical protein